MSTPYPGHIVMMGDPDQEVVATVQRRLVERGCGPLEASGVFDAGTRAVVRLFQARFPDRTGVPLVVDGKVGSLTWEALFGEGSVLTVAGPIDALLGKVLEVAAGEIGIREEPRARIGALGWTNASARSASIRRPAALRGARPLSSGVFGRPRTAWGKAIR
ncbi:MAG: peptidoglycan-binding protein [Candidatus Rokuibacteriota bacterium]|jgi:hypothetical protein